MKRVLVTGGAGYIGSHTCKALLAAGFEPVAFDNLSEGHAEMVKWGPLVEGDLADPHVVKLALEQFHIEAVIHFAASAYVGESMHNPRKYFRNNVANTINLLDAMLDVHVERIVFSSTCATYGAPDEVPIPEGHPQRPSNPYGETKLFVEKMLRWYGEIYGLQWMALRYFNASGDDPEGDVGEIHDPETHLIPLIIQAAMGEREWVDVYGTDYPTPDGTAIRDYIHVSDLASAHVLALQSLERGEASGMVNLGTGKGRSVLEVIGAVEAVSGRKVPVRTGPRRAGDPPALVANAARAREVLGWEPKYADLHAIVETAWRWHNRTR